MRVDTQVKIVSFVVAMLLLLLALLMHQNTRELRISNEIESNENTFNLRDEYEELVVGCNTTGALTSEDQKLRKLCDVDLIELHKTLYGEDN